MKKILIIYTKAGGGHLSLAWALEESLQKFSILNSLPAQAGQFSISLTDPFPRIYSSAYKAVGASFQDIYGKNYHLTDHGEVAAALHVINNALVGPRLEKLFAKEKPDLVVSTYPLATVEIYKALKKINLNAKIALLIADPFNVHELWLTFKKADLYLATTPSAAEIMVKNGLTAEKIKTVGWPVRIAFESPPVREVAEVKKLRETLGFDPEKFTVFLGGSGQGGGKIFETVKLIAHNSVLSKRAQVIVVTGLNRQVLSRLIRFTEDFPGLFNLFPYVNNVEKLMSISDLVCGKAGPNILFESIFRLRPFLATGCLPGQEEGNLDFIRREDLGFVEEDVPKAVELMARLLQKPELLTSKSPNLERIRRQNEGASTRAAGELVKLLS